MLSFFGDFLPKSIKPLNLSFTLDALFMICSLGWLSPRILPWFWLGTWRLRDSIFHNSPATYVTFQNWFI